MKNNKDFVAYLCKNKIITSQIVENVMLNVDRKDFTSADPYIDCPQYIGYNVTISAPHMHVYALEYLKDQLQKAKKCLDVGSGTGFLTVSFQKLMPLNGVSVGIEHIPQLVQMSIENVSKNHKQLLNDKVILIEGDGRLGYPKEAPYDVIHVGAACHQYPQELVDQLALGGRLIAPIGTYNQEFVQIDKDDKGVVTQKSLFGVRYVPLCDKTQQCPNLFK